MGFSSNGKAVDLAPFGKVTKVGALWGSQAKFLKKFEGISAAGLEGPDGDAPADEKKD